MKNDLIIYPILLGIATLVHFGIAIICNNFAFVVSGIVMFIGTILMTLIAYYIPKRVIKNGEAII
jgi:hypothetical protein